MSVERIGVEEWTKIAVELFGTNPHDWRFRCTSCGHEQSIREVMERHPNLNPDDVKAWIYFSCEGREWACKREKPEVGCDWTLGGLFQIHKIEVATPDGKTVPAFEFAHPDGMKKIVEACVSCKNAVCANPEHPGYVS